MCLYVKNGPFVAKKDILVYKRLICKITKTKYKFTSPYRGTPYYPNGHIYIKKLNPTKGIIYNRINKGLHAYVKYPCFKYPNEVVVKMVIPKGSTYYLGEYDEIVSTDLIWHHEKSVEYGNKYMDVQDWVNIKNIQLTKKTLQYL